MDNITCFNYMKYIFKTSSNIFQEIDLKAAIQLQLLYITFALAQHDMIQGMLESCEESVPWCIYTL